MTRVEYLGVLDRFLVALAQDVSAGWVLGFEDRHGEALARLIRDRAALDATPPGVDPRVIDAVRDVEAALAGLRGRLARPRQGP